MDGEMTRSLKTNGEPDAERLWSDFKETGESLSNGEELAVRVYPKHTIRYTKQGMSRSHAGFSDNTTYEKTIEKG